MKSPKSLVVTSSVKIPHSKALGQRQPAGEVFRVAHGDEQDVGSVFTWLWPELFITRRVLGVLENIGLAELVF